MQNKEEKERKKENTEIRKKNYQKRKRETLKIGIKLCFNCYNKSDVA